VAATEHIYVAAFAAQITGHTSVVTTTVRPSSVGASCTHTSVVERLGCDNNIKFTLNFLSGSMNHLVVIRYYKPGDELFCREIVKEGTLSTVNESFVSGLTR
jgi:hypothetical protein